MLLVTQPDPRIRRRLSRELADVADRFARELDSDLGCVNELVRHIERYRGKMLRPTLVLASAMAIRPQTPAAPEPHRVVATVVEMVHMATLVHDDILDEANLRRRGATVNSLHGNEAAVMLGDYLISHAYHLCSSLDRQLPSAGVSRTIAAATNTVCEGELLQLANRDNWQLDEQTYFQIITRKTASLCGTCCALAARLFEAPDAVAAALDGYGRKLGIAFQIVDDVLDLTGDERTVGKTLGRDLDKGKLTLPVIRALAGGAKGLIEALEQRDAEGVRRAVLSGDAVESARQTAAELVEDAKASLVAAIGESPARGLMLDIADTVLSRDF